MESEEIGNFSSISFDNTPTHHIIQDVVFTLFCIIAMITNAVLIYTILKFQRLRTVPNIILANWAIADLTCLLSTPNTYRLIAELDKISLSSLFMCTIYETANTAQATMIIFIILLSLDWCIAAYFKNASIKLRKYMKFYIMAIWFGALLMTCTSAVLCVHKYFKHWNQTITVFGFLGLFLFVILLHICKIVAKCKHRELSYPTVMLKITTSFVLCWITGFVNLVTMSAFGVFYRFLDILSFILIFCTSIVIFIILYRDSPDFQACLNRLLKKDRNNYEEADFNFNSSCRRPIVKNLDQCSFNDKEQNVGI